MDYEIAIRPPHEVHESEIREFVAMVEAGGEVAQRGLQGRVEKAKTLVFLSVAGRLAGVGALKRPEATYRSEVWRKSGIDVPTENYPIELGWVVVLPGHRSKGYGTKISQAALSAVHDTGIFATCRTDNSAMHRILEECGFKMGGQPYPARMARQTLQLFVRPALEREEVETVR